MGLGKTPEALWIDYKLRIETYVKGGPKRKTLIIAPLATHQDAWVRHIKLVWPTARIYVIDRKDRPAFVKALSQNYTCYIIHYEALRLMPELRRVSWFHIIADECHRAKSRKAQQTRALKALPARYKTGLSGTPADNRPADIWSILNWLYPKRYTSYWRHVKTYCVEQIVEGKNGATFRNYNKPNRETTPHLIAEMRPWYVRRLKREVLQDLPEKYYSDVWVELGPAQRKAYNQMRKDMIAWVGEHEDEPLVAPVVIAQLVRLQQFALASVEIGYKYVITRTARARALEAREEPEPERRMTTTLIEPSAKLDALEEMVSGNPTEQLVVWSQFRSMVDLAAQRLEANKISVGRYTGTVPQTERDLAVEAFQRGDLHVFAGTIAAGGEGITLHAASTGIFLDRHWSPTKNIQAEDRQHRIGQKNAVHIIDIMAKNTVDIGRRTVISQKWEDLRFLLGDTVDPEAYGMTAADPLIQEAMADAQRIFGRDLL